MLVDITSRMYFSMQEIQKMGEIPDMTINVDIEKEITSSHAGPLTGKLYEVFKALMIVGHIDNRLHDQAHRLDPKRFFAR